MWNSLADNVVSAEFVNSFKPRLNNFWYMYITTEPIHLLPEVKCNSYIMSIRSLVPETVV